MSKSDMCGERVELLVVFFIPPQVHVKDHVCVTANGNRDDNGHQCTGSHSGGRILYIRVYCTAVRRHE